MTTPPIACTLTATGMPKRLAELSAIGASSLLDDEVGPATAVLRFRADETTRDRLRAVIDAEATCCAFLEFTLGDGEDALTLTITAPEGGEPAMHELVSAFRGEAPVTG